MQAGEGGEFTHIPFHYIYQTYKVVVYAPAERADTLPLVSTLPLYVLCVRESVQSRAGIFRQSMGTRNREE
jgi:hypothetical protein